MTSFYSIKLNSETELSSPTDPLYNLELTPEDESGSSESKFASGISLMSALFPFESSESLSSSTSKPVSRGGVGNTSNIKFFTTGRAIPLDVVSSIERVGVIPYVKFPVVHSQPFVKIKTYEDDTFYLNSSCEVAPKSQSSMMRFVPKHHRQNPLSQESDQTVDILSLHEEAGAISRYWFAMAVDAQYGELTDCGGKRESFLEPIERTAVRELYEESMGVFDFRKRECEILNSHAITNGTTCIFFVRVHPSDRYGFPYNLPSLFQKNKQSWFNNVSGSSDPSVLTPAFRRGGSTPTHVPTPTTRFRTRYVISQQNQKKYPFRTPQNSNNHHRQDIFGNVSEVPPLQPNTSTLTSSLPSLISSSSSRGHNAFFENSCMYWIPGSDLEKILEIRTKKVNKKKYHISPIPFTRLSSNTTFPFNGESVFNETEIELSRLIQLEKDTGRLPKKKLTFLTPTSLPPHDPLASGENLTSQTITTCPIKREEDPAIMTMTYQKREDEPLQTFPTSPTSFSTSATTSVTTIIKHPFMYETIRKLLYPVWSVFKEKL